MTNFVSLSANVTAMEVYNITDIKVQVEDSNGRAGIVPMLFTKSAECLAIATGKEQSKRDSEQIQFNFLVNRKMFQNEFDTDEAAFVQRKFQESFERVFNGMSVEKSIEFTGFRRPKVYEAPGYHCEVGTMCCEKDDKRPCLIASMNILISKIVKLENNIDFMTSIMKGLDFVLEDLDDQVELYQPMKKKRQKTATRFSSLDPVQPAKVPHGVSFAINYFFGFHGTLVLSYFIRKNWELIVESHKMSWYYGDTFSDRLSVVKSGFILSVGVATVVVESKTFLDYISGSRVQFRPVGSVAVVLGVLCITQMVIFYGKWFIWIKIWRERCLRFRNFGVYDRMIKEEDTSIAMAKIVLIIILHDLAYQLLMYFYFARFKPTSLQMTPATVLVPLLDFILQVLPLLFQLFKRISGL